MGCIVLRQTHFTSTEDLGYIGLILGHGKNTACFTHLYISHTVMLIKLSSFACFVLILLILLISYNTNSTFTPTLNIIINFHIQRLNPEMQGTKKFVLQFKQKGFIKRDTMSPKVMNEMIFVTRGQHMSILTYNGTRYFEVVV